MLEFHHVGILVDDIASAADHYRGLFGAQTLDGPYDIESQGVCVAFLPMGQGYLEFVQQRRESTLLDSLRKRKVKYYHVGYLTRQFDDAMNQLTDRDYKHISTFHSEAFSMRRCAFLFSPELHLLELIEKN